MGIHEIANNAKDLCMMLGNKTIVQNLVEHEYLLYQSASDMLTTYFKTIERQLEETSQEWKS